MQYLMVGMKLCGKTGQHKHIECNINNDIPVKYAASIMF